MAVVSVQQALSGAVAPGSEVTVRGWVRTRRDSKAGLSFVTVSDGSCFAPIQVVAPADLAIPGSPAAQALELATWRALEVRAGVPVIEASTVDQSPCSTA